MESQLVICFTVLITQFLSGNCKNYLVETKDEPGVVELGGKYGDYSNSGYKDACEKDAHCRDGEYCCTTKVCKELPPCEGSKDCPDNLICNKNNLCQRPKTYGADYNYSNYIDVRAY
ncbi:uncharacterized protein LOC111697656 [Eurytemora carolleeae]|uniref:uncharacterized protein LOC111697656 n=1 Tax=Eurytemora carolleeae TaxID=1294199 RepID=UPI000C76BA70|nr:uncharacterized protein LOC111697656 [Eurytemora carolleeae]|eukprot:XP_023323502.1 uncharacterized protein LOC111697656 [Eurytemora affinis]